LKKKRCERENNRKRQIKKKIISYRLEMVRSASVQTSGVDPEYFLGSKSGCDINFVPGSRFGYGLGSSML
jgi:hypothetical protein